MILFVFVADTVQHHRNNIDVFFPTHEAAVLAQQLSPEFRGFTEFDNCSLFWYATDEERRSSSFSTKLGGYNSRKYSDTLNENPSHREDEEPSDEEANFKDSSLQDERMALADAEDAAVRLSQITGLRN